MWDLLQLTTALSTEHNLNWGKTSNTRFTLVSPAPSIEEFAAADQRKALAQGCRNLAENDNICRRMLSRIITCDAVQL